MPLVLGAFDVNRNEVRHELISALLQAAGPLSLNELVAESGVVAQDAADVLRELARQRYVVAGRLIPGKPEPQYRWAARWQNDARRRTAKIKKRLSQLVSPDGILADNPNIDSEETRAFHCYIINEYSPPTDKRLLVFLQCSVRRPFSSSPSHASMRRAIWVATGLGPSRDFEICPVHVVVLASRIGPVPYELEDVYPANVRSGGVKHFSAEHYARVKPILAQRMAEYITTHRDSYEHIATFTDGRYGEVMKEAGKIAAVDFAILPDERRRAVARMGRSRPRKYWEKYWIQLYLEIVGWLDPAAQSDAEARLREMDVDYR